MKGMRLAAVVAAVALLVAACGDSGGTKAGGDGGPVTLRMANPYAHLNYEPAVGYFVEQVAERSGGDLQVELVHEWGEFAPDAEQRLVRAVAAGDVDMGWVGTRVLDTLGVDSFRALTAPMLVDSYALQRVLFGSDLPGQMLDGLDSLDVTGLAVLAGGLRRPIAVESPLLGPPDWQGRTVQTFRSAGQAATIRALGATPIEVGPEDRDAGLAAGAIHGLENSLLIYTLNAMHILAPYTTLNVVLWPETTVLLVNPDRLAGLTDQRAGWLREAAADAASRSADLVGVDADVIADACEAGARFALASEPDLAALREAVAPVYEQLSQDPETGELIARIEELKTSATGGDGLTIPDGCTGEAPVEAGPQNNTEDLSVLNGIYRLEWTLDELVAGGLSPEEASDSVGVATLEFDNGRLVWSWQGSYHCVGSYTISGGRVGIVSGEGPEWECGGPGDRGREHFTAAWRLSGGELVFSDIRASGQFRPDQEYFEVFFGGKPWTKVG